MIDYRKTRDFHSGDVHHAYTAKDSMLYALGLGLGADPLDAQQLRFVYEKDLVALPTMASVLASPGFWMRDRPELGIDAMKMVHGEQAMQLHAPLPPAGAVIGRTRVTRIVDKGEGKGAIVHVEKQVLDDTTHTLLATIESVYFCRGDGGFSKADGVCDEPAPAATPMPDGAPERSIDIATRPDQALLYRLSGDINPLHADPAAAARAGFPRPILHGLATWGIAAHAILGACAGFDTNRFRSMRARLSAPVFPGETIRVECWTQGDGIAFRAKAVERDVLVLTNGHVGLTA